MPLTAAFFKPTKNLEPLDISKLKRPINSKESNELFNLFFKRAMDVLTGVNKHKFNEKDKYDLLNHDPFFILAIEFFTIFRHADPNKESNETNHFKVYESSLGVFHYINIFVPLTLLCEYGAFKMKEKSLEKNNYDNDFSKNYFLYYFSYVFFGVVCSHLLLLSIVTHSFFAFIQKLLAATLVTLTSFIWYPIILSKTLSPLEYDIKHYNPLEDDYSLSSSEFGV